MVLSFGTGSGKNSEPNGRYHRSGYTFRVPDDYIGLKAGVVALISLPETGNVVGAQCSCATSNVTLQAAPYLSATLATFHKNNYAAEIRCGLASCATASSQTKTSANTKCGSRCHQAGSADARPHVRAMTSAAFALSASALRLYLSPNGPISAARSSL